MGNNLPPGVNPGDPDAPWNEQPAGHCRQCGNDLYAPSDHAEDCPDAPWTDHCPECGEATQTPWDHERGCSYFSPKPKPKCSVCNPRHDEHQRRNSVFCSNHGPDDLRAMERHHDADERREQRDN